VEEVGELSLLEREEGAAVFLLAIQYIRFISFLSILAAE
jgi:hypothetical protein